MTRPVPANCGWPPVSGRKTWIGCEVGGSTARPNESLGPGFPAGGTVRCTLRALSRPPGGGGRRPQPLSAPPRRPRQLLRAAADERRTSRRQALSRPQAKRPIPPREIEQGARPSVTPRQTGHGFAPPVSLCGGAEVAAGRATVWIRVCKRVVSCGARTMRRHCFRVEGTTAYGECALARNRAPCPIGGRGRTVGSATRRQTTVAGYSGGEQWRTSPAQGLRPRRSRRSRTATRRSCPAGQGRCSGGWRRTRPSDGACGV
jgi:hypothetical protein